MERDGRGEAQAGMTPILAALRAEPFDPAALTQALSGLRSRAERATDLAEQVLVSRVAAMSPAERLAFADRIAARAQEGRRRD
jgi:uncharacterized membrane protein